MISVVIFNAAFENQKASLFMQCPGRLLVPERSYWDAHEHTSKYGPASVANQDANHDLTELVDSGGGKDTHVLADDGNLG